MKEKAQIPILFFLSLAFLISPVSGVFLALIHITLRQVRSLNYIHFIILFSILLGVINAGKLPESDLVNYQIWFNEVPYYSFFDYLLYKGKEPIFFLYNYLLYYLSSGSFEAYLILHTTICYSLIGLSLLRVHQFLNFSKYYLIAALLVLFLFPNIFSLSAHLIRQFLAASICSYLGVEIIFYQRKKVLVFLLAVFAHTSAIIYGVLYTIRKLNFNKTQLFFAMLTLTAIIVALFKYPHIFLPASLNSSFISYGIERVQNRSEAHELENLGMLNYFFIIFVIGVFLKSIKEIGRPGKMLFYFSMILLIFITVNYSDTELAMRFSFYIYFLFPTAIYLLLRLWKIIPSSHKRPDVIVPFLVIFGMWFIYKIKYGAWKYENLENLIFIGYW